MKRLIIAALFILLAAGTALIFLYRSADITSSDYKKWELQCMNEYQASQEYYVFADVPTNKMFVYKGEELLKEYRISTAPSNIAAPIGVWRLGSIDDSIEAFGGTWISFHAPWGKYGIYSSSGQGSYNWNSPEGYITMNAEDFAEFSRIIRHGTRLEVNGGPLGPFGSSLRTISLGDRGSDVLEIQRRMKLLGFYEGEIDGIFDAEMEEAVERFQKENKLFVDKKIGKRMYELLGVAAFE